LKKTIRPIMDLQHIPTDYILIHRDIYNKFFKGMEWQDIVEPTIRDVSEYLGIGEDKIKKDLKKHTCPLRETYNGGKGRGNQKRFIKTTVDAYKIWIINN